MIACFGSLNADFIYELDRLPTAGQTVRSRRLHIEAGGKGANQALAAALDGAAVAMVGAVGRDPLAEVALSPLKSAGVDIDGVVAGGAPTGTASIYVDADGCNEIVIAAGANDEASAGQLDDAALRTIDILMLQMETPPAEVATLLARAKAAGVRTLLNLAPAIALDAAALRLADVLIVNEDEAETAAGWLGCAGDAEGLSAALGTNVLRTLGAEGAEFAGPLGRCRLPARPVAAVDTTAAGDCFIGVFAAALDRGDDLVAAMSRATTAAGLACSRRGSQSSLPNRTEISAALP
ncbi:MAG: ribokinase [Ancalomicrobiaceae bacterium]|nr:ribokinase [Ancalomicrobiaceae bacterium]